jgi:hypothetical protein
MLSEADLNRDNNAFGAGTRKKTKVKKPTSIVIPEERYPDGPSSSLSSASTIPLDDLDNPGSPRTDMMDSDNDHDLHNEPGLAEEALSKNKKRQEDETSLDIMDMLTRELIKFQRKYGSGSYCCRRSHPQTDYDHQQQQQQEQQQQQLAMLEEGRVTRSGNNGSGTVRLYS